MKKNCLLLINLIIILAFCLIGCGDNQNDDTFDETTITIDKKGRVTEQVVASFDKDYYDVSELEAEFVSAIDSYDKEVGEAGRIKLKNVQLKGNSVYIGLDFNSTADYEGLIKETLFCGTVNEAYDNGYIMDVMLKGTEQGDKIGKIEIMGMIDKHIIIMSEPVKIRSFYPIAYVSANVDVLGEKEARVVSESGGLAYLILEK